MSLAPSRPESRPERLTAQEVRQRLEHERDTRLAQLDAVVEAGQDSHFAASQQDSVRRVLAEIDGALARLEDGTYGTCEGCGKPIPVERLEILPHTRFCVTCRRSAG
jgi:DnaK suppressor protein